MTKKIEYRRRLMHIQPVGATFFITWRLAGSLPWSIYRPLAEKFDEEKKAIKLLADVDQQNTLLLDLRRRQLLEIDRILDSSLGTAICDLSHPELAKIVRDQIHRFDGNLYSLIAYCIMPNHVHLVIDTSIQLSTEMILNENWDSYKQLDEILKRIKGASSRYLNIAINRSGQLWQKESYDIYIRNEKMLSNVVSYVLENPVKSGICKTWDEYPNSYLA